MKRINPYAVMILLATLLAVAVFMQRESQLAAGESQAAASKAEVTRWEHKISELDADVSKAEAAINQLGEQGWECAAVWGKVIGRDGKVVTNSYVICKRPMP